MQAETAALIRAGRTQDTWASMMTSLLPAPLRGPARPLARIVTAPMVPDDPTDLLVTLEAEDAFDVFADLPRITAPTLVIGGTKDPFYPRELFEETAARVVDGRAHVVEGWGHLRTGASAATWSLTLGFMLGERASGPAGTIDAEEEPDAASGSRDVAAAR